MLIFHSFRLYCINDCKPDTGGTGGYVFYFALILYFQATS